MTTPKLTPARRRALAALAQHDGIGRYSNTTDPDAGTIYWQTADWLITHGYATRGPDFLTLTHAGRQLAQEAAG